MEINIIPCAADVSHVHLSGRMDPHRTQIIDERFREETAGHSRPAVVDMSQVTFITSVGIGLLVECAALVGKAGHAFVLIPPVGHVDEVLRRTGIYEIIASCLSIDEALALATGKA
jgi:anti-anti-sigma factor